MTFSLSQPEDYGPMDGANVDEQTVATIPEGLLEERNQRNYSIKSMT